MKYRMMIAVCGAILLLGMLGIWLGPEPAYEAPNGELVGGEMTAIEEPIDTIVCNWASGDIRISESPDAYVHHRTLSPKGSAGHHAYSCSWYEGEMTIDDDLDEGFTDKLIGEKKNNVLELQLPQDQITSFVLEQQVGDVTIDGVNISSLDVAMGPGDLTLSGNIDTAALVMEDGDLYFTTETVPASLSVSGKAGDAWIDLPANDGFTLRHDLGDGALTSNFYLIDQDDTTAIHGNGAAQISVTLADGSLEIR